MAEYRIVDRIGQGGMGIVYRAMQEPLDRPVAVKILPSSLMSTSGTAVPRFLREIQACTKLNHPNIIRIIDCGEMSGQPFFAMEYLEAMTLKEMIAEGGPLPASLVTDIFKQMLEALEYCHAQGMVHRDIKPHNIMVDGLNHATLMDFGLVKMLERSGITHSKRMIGSPNYMPPEMIQGRDIGVQADLWSLGCVIYEILTGERAFPGKVIREIGLLILRSEPVPVRSKRPDCPAGLALVIEGCLKKDTAERYQCAEHVLKDLQRMEAGRAPLGPAAQGQSSAAVVLPALAEADVATEKTARATRKHPVARGTRKEAVHATLTGLAASGLEVAGPGGRSDGLAGGPDAARPALRARSGLPAEPKPGWFSWRALVPRTWLERLVAAGLLVVVALGLIVGALLNVGHESPAGAEPATEVKVEAGPDFVELTWKSASAYAAVASAGRADAGGDLIEIPEREPRTVHKLRLGGLERGVTYQIRVKSGERMVFSGTARTLAPSDLADRLEAAIQALAPVTLASRLEHDLAALTPRERQRGSGSAKRAALALAHRKVIHDRLASSDVAGALARFRGRKHDFFLEDGVPATRKRAVWMAVEMLEDLRTLAQWIDVEVPSGVEALKDAGYGPVSERSAGRALAHDVRLKRGGGHIVLYTKAGSPDGALMRGGPPANLSEDIEERLTAPADARGVDVGLGLSPMAATARITLWMGASGGTTAPVAVFRGSDVPSVSWVVLDPRLFNGPQRMRLELTCFDSVTPFREQAAVIRSLTFHFHANGQK